MAGDRRGSQVQEPGTKTEAVICPGEQDRATQDQHRHHRPGRRERGTKGPKTRNSSLAGGAQAPHPPPSTRMTASSSQRRHGATARVRPAQGTQNLPVRDQEPAPPCPGIWSQKETEIDDLTDTQQPVANRNGTHRQRCVALSGPGKPDRTHRL